MLVSNRAEVYLPEGWSAHYDRPEFAQLGPDGKRYLDLGLMGVGTKILGFSHSKVDKAVKRTVARGNLYTLNMPEDVYFAQAPIRPVTGAIDAPTCGPRPVRTAIEEDTCKAVSTTIATPDKRSAFELTLPAPTTAPITMTMDSQGTGCAEGEPNPSGGQEERYSEIFDLSTR